jgi:dihydrofolate synthase / folylpolyglutamate synthase
VTHPQSRELKTALSRLYSLIGKGQRQGLAAMQEACAKLGHPERAFKTIHVAGTNGKGTVAAFVSSMCMAANHRVGLYTSPHLIRFAERIRIQGHPIEDEALATYINHVLDRCGDLTFFETATCVAFLAFSDAGVSHAVLEVGLGGRLDATNVIPPPEVAVITRVAYDHMDVLGADLRSIAKEKAGIIKAASKVIVGRLHPDAQAVVAERCKEVGATLLPLGSPEPVPGAPLAYPRLSMVGTNMAVAVTVGRALGFSPQQLARGVETMDWPGRNELLHRNRKELTLLDCAHNPDGAVALSHTLDPAVLEVDSRRDVALVFGTVVGKNYRAMLQRLEMAAAHRIYVAPPVDRAQDPTLFQKVLPGEVAPNVETALRRAREIVGSSGVVVVTGSTFLVGAARSILLNLPRDPAVAM